MSEALTDDLPALLAAATPGPWRLTSNGGIDAGEYDTVLTGGQVDCMAYCYGGSSTLEIGAADAALIVAAVNALPDLLAELATARTAWETWRETAINRLEKLHAAQVEVERLRAQVAAVEALLPKLDAVCGMGRGDPGWIADRIRAALDGAR